MVCKLPFCSEFANIPEGSTEEKETGNSKAFRFTSKRKKSGTLQYQHLRQLKMYFCFFLFHCLFLMEYVLTYAVGNQFSNRKYLLELI